MSKSKLMLRSAALCAGLAAQAALAQSPTGNVSLYGVLDIYLGAVHSSGKTAYGIESGGQQVSRFVLRGVEELGGGLSARFTLENGFNTYTGSFSVANTIFNRQAWVGLAGTSWGELRFGQQNSVMFTLLGGTAAFYGGSFAAGLGTESGYNFRNSNDISYATPRLAGWRGEFHYALGEQPEDHTNGSVWQTAIDYRQGPLYLLGAILVNHPKAVAPVPYTGLVNRQYTFGGAYEIKPFTVYLSYFRNKQSDNAIDKSLYSISTAWKPDDRNQVSIGYTYIDTRADNANVDLATFKGKGHANHLALLYLHHLSTRTTIYSALANISNTDGLRYAMGAAQAPSGALLNRPLGGDPTTGVQLGIRHTF